MLTGAVFNAEFCSKWSLGRHKLTASGLRIFYSSQVIFFGVLLLDIWMKYL
jgi:hypothetical protein